MNEPSSHTPAPPRKIAVIGGDLRQLEAAKSFAQRGYDCQVFGLDVIGDSRFTETVPVRAADSLADALRGADLVLLPLPYSHDGVTVHAPLSTQKITVSSLFTLLSEKQKIAAGLLGQSLPKPFSCFDYAASEVFAIRNARATVEGALAIAIRETPMTLCGATVSVVGYGRIGKMLSSALASLGAKVSVFARSPDQRAWAQAEGLTAYALDSLGSQAHSWDVLFNTVPSRVITEEILAAMKKDAVIIELASLPGGVDLHGAAKHGIHMITASGLPGKYSPQSAGRIIADTVADRFGL